MQMWRVRTKYALIVFRQKHWEEQLVRVAFEYPVSCQLVIIARFIMACLKIKVSSFRKEIFVGNCHLLKLENSAYARKFSKRCFQPGKQCSSPFLTHASCFFAIQHVAIFSTINLIRSTGLSHSTQSIISDLTPSSATKSFKRFFETIESTCFNSCWETRFLNLEKETTGRRNLHGTLFLAPCCCGSHFSE